AESRRVIVRPLQNEVSDQPRGDHAECDAIPPIAQGGVDLFLTIRPTDKREPVFRFGKGAGPEIFGDEWCSGKELLELVLEAPPLLKQQSFGLMIIGKRSIFAANHRSAIRRLAGIEIR